MTAQTQAIGALRHVVPPSLRKAVRTGLLARRLASSFSTRDALRLARAWWRAGRAAEDATPPFTVTVRSMGGIRLPIRPGTSDVLDLVDTVVDRFHLPPDIGDIRLIVDAGLCTGLTLADFATQHPAARVIGIEPQTYYARLAAGICSAWADRVSVIEAALWTEELDDASMLVQHGREFGATLAAAERTDAPVAHVTERVRCITLDAIVAEHGPIDFLKLDIEGAERAVLTQSTAWAAAVRCIKVEVHGDYTVADCSADLERLGFTTQVDSRHWACVTGLKQLARA